MKKTWCLVFFLITTISRKLGAVYKKILFIVDDKFASRRAVVIIFSRRLRHYGVDLSLRNVARRLDHHPHVCSLYVLMALQQTYEVTPKDYDVYWEYLVFEEDEP